MVGHGLTGEMVAVYGTGHQIRVGFQLLGRGCVSHYYFGYKGSGNSHVPASIRLIFLVIPFLIIVCVFAHPLLLSSHF